MLQGEKECSYYLKTGQCKFGVTCKFHHPQPDGIQMAAPAPGPLQAPTIYPAVQSPPVPSSQQYAVVASNWPVARPTMLPGSYIPGTYSPMLLPPGMLPFQGWSPYQVRIVLFTYFLSCIFLRKNPFSMMVNILLAGTFKSSSIS